MRRLHRRGPVCATAKPVVSLALAATLAACGQPGTEGSQNREPASEIETPAASASGALSPTGTKAAALPPCPPSTDLAAVDRGLPRRTFDCLGDGPKVTLSGLRGRPMVVNVWASWCPPCAREMPYLVQARAAAGDRVLFLGIDLEDAREQGLAWARDLGMNFPSVYDPDGDVKKPLGLLGPPVTYFVRSDGTIAFTHSGPLASAAQVSELTREHLGVRL
jgi:cytochrome c biogenesis protein CcmG/thiol:disulfide interchange protein DsbE